MTRTVTFWVPGTPAPGGSKRSFKHNRTGRIVTMEDCKRNPGWRESVKVAAMQAFTGDLLSGPLSLTVEFRMPRPACHFGSGRNAKQVKPQHADERHTKKPDATKLLRALEDALTGIIWHDDAAISDQEVRKRWTNGNPGAQVTITET